MKYINADTLIDELKDTFDDGDGIAIGEYWSSKIVRSVIDNLAKDIDVRENVKGEWKPKTPLSKSYRFVCSVCGGTAYYCSGSCASTRDRVKNICKYNYCPNCGADMRKEEEE